MVLIFSMPRAPAAASNRENTRFSMSTSWLALSRRDRAVNPTRSANTMLTSPWMSAMVVSPPWMRSTISRGIIECSRSSTRARLLSSARSVWNSRRAAISRPMPLSATISTAVPMLRPLTIIMSPAVRPSSTCSPRKPIRLTRLGTIR